MWDISPHLQILYSLLSAEKKSACPQRKNMKFNFFSLWIVGSSVSDIHFSCEDPSSSISTLSSICSLKLMKHFMSSIIKLCSSMLKITSIYCHGYDSVEYLFACILDKWEKKICNVLLYKSSVLRTIAQFCSTADIPRISVLLEWIHIRSMKHESFWLSQYITFLGGDLKNSVSM